LKSDESVITPSMTSFLTKVLGAQYSMVCSGLSACSGEKNTTPIGPTADENSRPPKVSGAFLNMERL